MFYFIRKRSYFTLVVIELHVQNIVNVVYKKYKFFEK